MREISLKFDLGGQFIVMVGNISLMLMFPLSSHVLSLLSGQCLPQLTIKHTGLILGWLPNKINNQYSIITVIPFHTHHFSCYNERGVLQLWEFSLDSHFPLLGAQFNFFFKCHIFWNGKWDVSIQNPHFQLLTSHLSHPSHPTSNFLLLTSNHFIQYCRYLASMTWIPFLNSMHLILVSFN